MGLHLSLLALVLLVGTAASAAPIVMRPLCLYCHTSHYTEQGNCSSCHRGNERSSRKVVAHSSLVPGRYLLWKVAGNSTQPELLTVYSCRRCHVTGGTGNGLAAPLDNSVRTRHPLELAAAIRQPSRFMPDFRFSQTEITMLVNELQAEAVKAQLPDNLRELPLVVHFQKGKTSASLFEKKCGSCHRLLSVHNSNRGTGDIGPNLSGLFTSFYPATFQDSQRWTSQRLQRWLQNPRRIKKMAGMQPVILNAQEFAELCSVITDSQIP